MPAAARRPATGPDPQIRRWIARELVATQVRAPSLIITVWGDAIVPHGGAVMLPGLLRLLSPLGLNERRGAPASSASRAKVGSRRHPSAAAACTSLRATAPAASSRRIADLRAARRELGRHVELVAPTA
jgi:hypothetical protein